MKRYDNCDELLQIYIAEYMTRSRLATLGFQTEMTIIDAVDAEILLLIDQEFQKAKAQGLEDALK